MTLDTYDRLIALEARIAHVERFGYAKLNPCSKCGGTELVMSDTVWSGERRCRAVWCSVCRESGPIGYTEREAALAWNEWARKTPKALTTKEIS